MELREQARPFIQCHVNSGSAASFWHDDWTQNGPLLRLVGSIGPMVTGIPLDAAVSHVVRNGHWHISTRSRHPVLRAIRDALPLHPPNPNSADEDYYMWRNSLNTPPSVFSAAKIHLSLYPNPPSVIWRKVVWFKKRIPRHAFITWLVMKERMVTRDRLLSWGLDVSPTCLLCGVSNESSAHLFFECEFSRSVWSSLLRRSTMQHPTRLHDIIIWLSSPQITGKFRIILHLIFQATIYHLWKERNSRLHTSTSRPSNMILKDILLHLRSKLCALDREELTMPRPITSIEPQQPSYLHIWFDRIQG